MKPKCKTKPALWMQVPGAKPVPSADRTEFSHGPVRAGKTLAMQQATKGYKRVLKLMAKKAADRLMKGWKAKPRLKLISTARAKQLRQYASLKREFLLRYDSCRACGKEKPLDVHHRNGRVGKLLICEKFWIPLCRSCHDRCKTDPAWAYERGLLAPKGQYNSIPK